MINSKVLIPMLACNDFFSIASGHSHGSNTHNRWPGKLMENARSRSAALEGSNREGAIFMRFKNSAGQLYTLSR